MNKFNVVVLLWVLFSISTVAKANEEPKFQIYYPESNGINSSFMKPHKVRYEKSGGFMIYDVYKENLEGKEVFKADIYFNKDTGVPDQMYFDAQNLGYVKRILGGGEDSQYVIDVGYKEGRFSGSLTPKNDSGFTARDYDKQYDHGFFEPAIINYFVAALPLEKGFKASIPTLDLNNGSQIMWANIEVKGEEKIKINGKTYNTWKVISNGARVKTLWLSKDFPYALKMKTKGAGGTWKLAKVYD